MANVKRCDRCGGIYDPYNIANSSKNTNSLIRANTDNDRRYFPHDVIELCPKCNAAFDNWRNPQETDSAEEIKPLTIQEMKDMSGRPVWIEEEQKWGLVNVTPMGPKTSIVMVSFVSKDTIETRVVAGLHCYLRKPV